MPNLKIFADTALGPDAIKRIEGELPGLRDLICRELNVDIELAQLAIVEVRGLPDQAMLAVEMQVMPKPDRTREHLVATCERFRAALRQLIDVKIAIRVTTIDPENYLVMR